MLNKYKNIQLTKQFEEANCITHSGKFHVDDVMSTIFVSKIINKVILLRLATTENKDLENKLVYDIGLGEFDHHQKNRNGQRKNGIYYSSMGLLWKRFGKEYLKSLRAKDIDKTFKYIDEELIQYIDATDNMQMEYLDNRISPDFIKLCNPQWNEIISEDEAFINALKLADEFWDVYIKSAIAEVEAMDIILEKIINSKDCYIVFDREMPYRKAMKLYNNDKIKYVIFKSRREGYEIRTVTDSLHFKDEIVRARDINESRRLTGISELTYVDNHGKLCCTETIDSAVELVKYNESK